MLNIFERIMGHLVPRVGGREMAYDIRQVPISADRKQSKQDYIRYEQFKLIYRNAPLAILSNIFIASVVFAYHWGINEQSLLINWYGAIIGFSILRALLLLRHYQHKLSYSQITRGGWYLFVSTGISGCLWGYGGYIVYSGADVYLNSLMLLALCGMVSGAVSPLSAYSYIYYTYAIPALTPVLLILIMSSETSSRYLGLTVFGFLLMHLAFSNNARRSIYEFIALRFDHNQLAEELDVKAKEEVKLREEAEEANAVKSRFFAASSHDLRQPLHALGLFVDALQSTQDKKESHDIIKRISGSVENLGVLLTSILDISKLDAGSVDVNIQAINLKSIMDKIEPEFALQAEAKGIQFESNIQDVSIKTDPVLLNRILRNLMENAVKYTSTGFVKIATELASDEQLLIHIIDSGEGFPVSEYEHIFEEYYQLHNPLRTRTKGLGLGLAIVQRLCTLLGHKLSFDSIQNKGSRFSLSLPICSKVEVARNVDEVESWTLEGEVVVVIDDDVAIQDGMQITLSSWGCDVIAAGSIDDALAMLVNSGKSPDVIISDYGLLNNETGINAIEKIKQQYGEGIPAILITGDTTKMVLNLAKQRGYILLHKPVRPVQLRLVLNQLMR